MHSPPLPHFSPEYLGIRGSASDRIDEGQGPSCPMRNYAKSLAKVLTPHFSPQKFGRKAICAYLCSVPPKDSAV